MEKLTQTSHSLLFPKVGMKENNLDFIRFSLALLVLFCHCFVMYYGTEDTVEPLINATHKQLSLGSLAVNYFFVISGFLIFQSWDKSHNFLDFLKKRILRIFPGFIVASILCLVLFAPLGTADFYMPLGYWKLYFQHLNLPAFFSNMFTLQEPSVPWTLKYVPIADSINAPLWTIKYEFICYLLVPLLAVLGAYKKKIFLPILFVAAFACLLAQNYFGVYFWGWNEYPIIGKPDFLPRFFTYFMAGMCCYSFKEIIPRQKMYFWVSCIAVALGLFVFKAADIVLPIFGTYVLFYLAFNQTITFKNFTKVGDFSYGIYVYAWPVQQLCILYFEKYMNVSLLFILSVLFTMPLAWLSWNYIEKPFMKLNKKKLDKATVKTDDIQELVNKYTFSNMKVNSSSF